MKIHTLSKKFFILFLTVIMAVAFSSPASIKSRAADSNLIIMLDPGHGGEDGGAENTVDGVYYNENNLMLKIANYAKAELSQYPGVTVLLTREDTDTYLTLAQRVSKASASGAHAIVSIHANSYSGSSANGAEVLVACGNYRPAVATATQNMAQKILTQLKSIGLNNRGTVKKLDNQGDVIAYYPDGSYQDYYGIVQRALRAGIPGIIIETAFISNANDVRNHFSSDEKLERLGKAIATGIAQHYSLSKSSQATATARPHIDARSLTFSGSPDTSFLYPLSGTKITQSDGFATMTKGSDGIKTYLDYMGMAFSADTYKYAVIRLRSSTPDATATINIGAHKITYDTPEFTYKATLGTDFQNIVLDMSASEDWTLAVNFIKIQISGTTSADIEYIKFYESKAAIQDGFSALKPTIKPTQAPTAKPTAVPTQTVASEPTATTSPSNTAAPTVTAETLRPTNTAGNIATQTAQHNPASTASPDAADESAQKQKGNTAKTVITILLFAAVTAICIILLLKQVKNKQL